MSAQYSNCFLGPAEIQNQHPLGMLHYNVATQNACVGSKGESSFTTDSSIANTLNKYKDIYFIDAETVSLNLGFNYNLIDKFQLSLKPHFYSRQGGSTDQSIDEWHRVFGFPRGKRRELPRNEYLIAGINRDATTFDFPSKNLHLADTDLDMKYQILDGDFDIPTLSAVFSMRLPTAEAEYGQEAVDIAVGVVGSKKLASQFYFSSGVSYVHYLDTEISGLNFHSDNYSLFLTLEYSLNEQWNMYVSQSISSALVSEVPFFPNYQLYLDLGTRYKLTNKWLVELLIRENPAPREATTDISLSLGLKYIYQ
ncbi:MAG: DUF3187 family protein [Proteobacteria bacterium]|nr:DUF3187 family protein [Pseudomonadota bacterium]